jgi:beta-galactosidase
MDEKGMANSSKFTGPHFDDAAFPWQTVSTGTDVFRGKVGFAWFRANLPNRLLKQPSIHFATVDDNADVFLNGKFLLHHEGWDEAFDVNLAPAWSKSGPNELTVLVENTAGEGGITGNVTLSSGQPAWLAPAADKYEDKFWRTVHLPHDYVIEGKFSASADNSHGSLPKPEAWYRKTFAIPASYLGKSVSLQFDGVYRNSSVWINGHFLGVHLSGYTPFRYDLTDYLHYGRLNVVSVHVDPTHNEGWWYEGGGIYRHVWLDVAPRIAVAPNGVAVSTKFDEPRPGAMVPAAEADVLTGLSSRSRAQSVVNVITKILDSQGSVVATGATRLTFPAVDRVFTTLHVAHPNLWFVDRPYLYQVNTVLIVDGRKIDERTTPFGFRVARFDPARGFFLNGVPLKIQGACNHQDFAGMGVALPDSLEYWRVRKLKAMGCNAWRMSHNPPNPAILDACDRLGILVMDENRHLGDSPEVLAEVASMVQRDRNHPSIVIWSMCNEEPKEGTEKGARIFKNMRDTVLKFDTTRPITSAMNGGWFQDGFATVEDLMGVNYSYEVYDKYHKLHPGMPIFGSETASTVTTRGECANNKPRTVVTSYNTTDDSWRPAATRPFVAGTFIWTGFDYKGEPTPYSWPAIGSNFGVLDSCGFPKSNYFYYQSWWRTKPIVHIEPHWNWPGQEGKPIKVVIFSNSNTVELSLNGKSLGSANMPEYGHLEWSVPYQPGSLVAKGLNATGTVVASDTVTTTSEPKKLRISAGRTFLLADGEDVQVASVDVLDNQGRICPTAMNRVEFSISGVGDIAGVGNGNPGDHDPDKANYRNAFNGRCIVIVGAREKPGKFELVAKSKGLVSATLNFECLAKP